MKKLNKKGFTLVELLAVIAILAILMVIAIPGVLTLFNNGKENAFKTEAQSILKSAKTQWMGNINNSTAAITYTNYGAEKPNIIPDLSVGQDFYYRVVVTNEGKVTEICVSNKTHVARIEESGENADITADEITVAKIGATDADTACYTPAS